MSSVEKWVVQRTGRYTYQRVLRRFHPDFPVPSGEQPERHVEDEAEEGALMTSTSLALPDL
jgi:hypothetical protein